MLDDDIQCIFIYNLKKDIIDNNLFTKYNSLSHHYMILHHYELKVNWLESSTPIDFVTVNQSDVIIHQNKFSKHKNLIVVNILKRKYHDHVATT